MSVMRHRLEINKALFCLAFFCEGMTHLEHRQRPHAQTPRPSAGRLLRYRADRCDQRAFL